jgi:hypothetical protein
LGEARHREIAAQEDALVPHQSDPEVREPRLWLAVAILGDEDVLGLDVLVENAHGVGRRKRLRDLGDQQETGLESDRSDSTDGLSPVDEAASLGVFGLQEVRRLVEIPVQHLRDVVSVAELVLQDPEERGLAFQASQARGVEAELEHPALAGRVSRQPDLAEPALAELVDERPAVAPGHRKRRSRPPAERLFVAGTDGPPRGLRVGRRSQQGLAGSSDLEDVDGLPHALEQVGPMGQPDEAVAAAIEGIATKVEGGAREQDLPALCERGELFQ